VNDDVVASPEDDALLLAEENTEDVGHEFLGGDDGECLPRDVLDRDLLVRGGHDDLVHVHHGVLVEAVLDLDLGREVEEVEVLPDVLAHHFEGVDHQQALLFLGLFELADVDHVLV